MAQDETEFDKLLKEAREWDARDRARHKSFDIAQGAEAPRAPQPAPAATPKPAEATWGAMKAAMRQAKAQSRAQARSQPTGARRKSAWGWIWLAIVLYFVLKHFVR